MSSKTALRDEITALRATIHAAHDHIHNGRVEEAHEALHCQTGGDSKQPLPGQNIAQDDAARIDRFIRAFNALCIEHDTMAASVVLVPSATKPGYVSIQLGGHVPTIQYLRQAMGMAPTNAVRP